MAEMPRSEDLFLLLKRISWTLTAQLELRLKERNMRGTQVYFLVYLLRRHPQGTYLTELSREIGLSKSTLSPLIKRLRESGYLCVQENPSDVRRKRVCPTEKLLAEQRELLEKAGPDALFMHVLPANAGNKLWPDEKEVTREVMESDRNAAWDEAENRLSAMMALLVYYSRPHFVVPSPADIAYYEERTQELLSEIFDRRIS